MRQFIKRFTAIGLSTSLLLAFMFFPEVALAQTGGSNDALKNFSEIAATLVHIITAAAMLLIQFFPPLWGSELITGDQVTNMLRPMWIYIRNLTNIAFVGIMLFLAFTNLVTSGKGVKDWNIKSKLGPVILGLVAINFSMLAIRVMVDVVHVGTVALLSIADPVIEARGINSVADYYSRTIDTETFEDCEAGSGGNCKSVRELVNNTFCPSGPAGESCLFQIKQIAEIQAQAELMNNPEKKNIMLAFGSFFMKLESLPLLSADTGGLLDVLDSAIFSLIFGLAYLLALAAMMVVLLVRVVMMWVFIIFSPLLVTGWVLGINGLDKLSDEFKKYLIVPVKAAGALAFGFVMISQLQLMTIPSEFFVSVIEPGASLKSLWGPNEFGGWRMLWSILTVVLFWKVVFDFALTGMPGAAAIESFGKKAGSAALSFGADQVKIPGTGAEGSELTLASLLPGGGLNPNQFLQTASNRMRSEAGSSTDFRSIVGAGQSSSGLANDMRNSRSQDAARRQLERRDQQKFLDDFQNASADDRRDIIAGLNLALPTTSAKLEEDISPAELRRQVESRADIQGVLKPETPDDPNPGDATPVVVERDGDNITVNGSPVDITAPATGTAEERRGAVLTNLQSVTLDNAGLDQVLLALKDTDPTLWADIDTRDQLKAAIGS